MFVWLVGCCPPQLATAFPLKRVSSTYADERQYHDVAALVHPSVLARQLRFVADALLRRHPRLASMLTLHKETGVVDYRYCRSGFDATNRGHVKGIVEKRTVTSL